MIKIHRIINYPVPSNCYIISSSDNDSCIVIDPGTADNSDLINFIEGNKLSIQYVLLTHEHFDHCLGVNSLQNNYQFKLICSEKTASGVRSNRLNLSKYFEGVTPFEINMPCKYISEKDSLQFNNCTILFMETPGHSPGSICIKIGEAIFTGDMFLNTIKTPVNLPNCNKSDYLNSLQKINSTIKINTTIYPGHGEPFIFEFDKFNTENVSFPFSD